MTVSENVGFVVLYTGKNLDELVVSENYDLSESDEVLESLLVQGYYPLDHKANDEHISYFQHDTEGVAVISLWQWTREAQVQKALPMSN